ncbi:branched-chain amino acid ABC transporter permease [Saccharibacter sp. 17.LH.SD]|uniref:AzlC family ABC transporter permease n=1 Tax=Saccharibacter sp. 17.LH.SD TaxID=2689393 RepID=UPI00136FACE9|nr:AzlC family ABC transporter permease [Saccharibacter sp. 17.LH.SD]MXV44944.1 branched-chain amino acid ABC transporter permease [Saccharibacter sp. 17.LH.SD]
MTQHNSPSISPSHAYEFLRGVRTALPLTLAFIPFGLLLGSRAIQQGLTHLEIPLLTGLNFAGGSEFAAVDLWTLPPNILLLASTTFLINSRHILMGTTLTSYLQNRPRWQIFSLLFFMCDEVWALSLADTQKNPSKTLSIGFYSGVTMCLYSCWVITTFVGGFTGSIVHNLIRYGVDMAIPAVFLVLLRGMWMGRRTALPWISSLIAASLTYHFLPGAWYVLVGTITGGINAWIMIHKK